MTSITHRFGVLAAGVLVAALLPAAAAAAQDTPTCNGLPATIVGTDGPDRIEGTSGRDVIVALNGKDVIFGRDGNDVICGGPGNDVIKGGRGNDYIEGNQGNDKLIGNIGRDTLDGGNAKDKLFGGGGPDKLIGGSKRDVIYGENGEDTCDLDRLDFFSACELGDVLGGVGVEGSFLAAGDPDFSLEQLFPFVVAWDNEIDFPVFVQEFYFESAGTNAGVELVVLDLAGELLTLFASDEPSGLARIVLPDAPGAVLVTGTTYFEWVLVSPELIQRRPRSTSGALPDVFRVDPPIPGPAAYEFTFDPTELAFLDIYPQFDGLPTFDGAFDESGDPLVGEAFDGAWLVGVDAHDWTLDLAESTL